MQCSPSGPWQLGRWLMAQPVFSRNTTTTTSFPTRYKQCFPHKPLKSCRVLWKTILFQIGCSSQFTPGPFYIICLSAWTFISSLRKWAWSASSCSSDLSEFKSPASTKISLVHLNNSLDMFLSGPFNWLLFVIASMLIMKTLISY